MAAAELKASAEADPNLMEEWKSCCLHQSSPVIFLRRQTALSFFLK